MPNDLTEWIQEQFPNKEVVYRGRTFLFHSDVPIADMEEVAACTDKGKAQVQILLKVMSIDPKITDDVLAVMNSTMLMELYTLLFPKNDPTSSPSENTNDTSSVPS